MDQLVDALAPPSLPPWYLEGMKENPYKAASAGSNGGRERRCDWTLILLITWVSMALLGIFYGAALWFFVHLLMEAIYSLAAA
ncbi:MAG TPA: hypothetical protein VHC22_12555 [Pirellulales bacterium]|nr:hypothetical protein [Pirellulales bacterium]